MNLAEFHFVRPYWLLALIPSIIFTVLFVRHTLNQGNWSNVCDADLLPFILQQKPSKKSYWTLSTGTLACLLIIFSLAGPTWQRLPSPVFRNDSALVIALDLSRSMDAEDIKPSRLSRARFKISDILKQRKDGQTALLVYAGDSFTVTPLTNDTKTINSQLSALTTDIMPTQGSNTVLALNKAVQLLKQAGLQSGEILLLTDGINADATRPAINSLSAYRLSILGIGTSEGAPIKVSTGGFLKDAQGNIVVPKLDASNLSALATGLYRTISSDDSDIDALMRQLNQPSKKQAQDSDNLLIEQWDEKGPWLLLLALPLIALNFRKGLLSIGLLVLLPFPNDAMAFEWEDLWQTQNQHAQQAYNQNNYQQAAEQFNNPHWKAAAQYKAGQFEQAAKTLQTDESATGLYNKANALAQAGQLEAALKGYEQSLQLSPNNEDAQYNKQHVEEQLEKQKQQENKDSSSDEEDSKKDDKQQKSDEQKDGENEPSDKKNDPSEKSDQSPQQEDKEDQESDKQQEDQEEPQESPTKPKPAEEASTDEYDESEQANEQWLNRIPDDPSGLLKRKFKYQYNQRDRKNNSSQAW